MKLIISLFILTSLSLSLLGCTVGGPSINHFTNLASRDADQIASRTERFDIRLNENYYAQINRDPIEYLMSTKDFIGEDVCGINRDDLTADPTRNEDIYCTLDINEADFLLPTGASSNNELPLSINTPEETCYLTSFQMPWHWNQPAGQGPSILLKTTLEPDSDSADSAESREYYLDVCKYRGLPQGCESTELTESTESALRGISLPTPTNRGAWKILGENGSLSKLFCGNFDPSTEEGSNLANCCLGSYDLYERDSKTSVVSPSSRASWGGSIKECIGGATRSFDWPHFSGGEEPNFPLPRVSRSWENGFRDQINLPLKSYFLSDRTSIRGTHPVYFSLGIANYYEGIEDQQWSSDNCEGCPQMYKSSIASDTSDKTIWYGYPYFTLECIDQNLDTIQRIHLSIREWNTLAEFDKYVSSDGANGDPDVTGEEGGSCNNYESDEFGKNQCNDFLDIDDVSDIVRPLVPEAFTGYPILPLSGGSAN